MTIKGIYNFEEPRCKDRGLSKGPEALARDLVSFFKADSKTKRFV